jgi:hypothetical protein
MDNCKTLLGDEIRFRNAGIHRYFCGAFSYVKPDKTQCFFAREAG